jgi:RHS repeat-associated protein
VLLAGGARNTFAYDAAGHRVQREDSGGLSKLVWDGENVLRESDAGGTLVAQYTLRPELYGDLVSQRRSGATKYHLFDGLGSTDRLADSSQTVTDTYWYEGYGAARQTQGASANPFRYIGRVGYYYDPDTGLYQVRARFYSPANARWISMDPIGFNARDGNLYRYVGNCPFAYVDPSGLSRCLRGSILKGLPPLPSRQWGRGQWTDYYNSLTDILGDLSKAVELIRNKKCIPTCDDIRLLFSILTNTILHELLSAGWPEGQTFTLLQLVDRHGRVAGQPGFP